MNRIKNVKDKHKKVSLSSYDVINRFMVAVVVSMMVLIGLLFFTAVKSVNRYTRLIYISNSRALIQSYATAVSDEIDGCFSDLSYCVYADVVRTDDPVKIVNWLQGRRVGLPSYAMNLFFCGRDGVCHSYNGRKFNAMYTDYFKAIMIDHEQRFVTDPRVSPVTGLEEFIVCRAVHNSRNENIGLFGFSVLVMHLFFEDNDQPDQHDDDQNDLHRAHSRLICPKISCCLSHPDLPFLFVESICIVNVPYPLRDLCRCDANVPVCYAANP